MVSFAATDRRALDRTPRVGAVPATTNAKLGLDLVDDSYKTEMGTTVERIRRVIDRVDDGSLPNSTSDNDRLRRSSVISGRREVVHSNSDPIVRADRAPAPNPSSDHRGTHRIETPRIQPARTKKQKFVPLDLGPALPQVGDFIGEKPATNPIFTKLVFFILRNHANKEIHVHLRASGAASKVTTKDQADPGDGAIVPVGTPLHALAEAAAVPYH